MFTDNRIAQGKPQAHTFLGTPLLGGKIRVEDTGQVLFADSTSLVPDRDLHVTPGGKSTGLCRG